MKRQRNAYARLEKSIYEFDQIEIQHALLTRMGYGKYEEGRTIEFEWATDDNGNLTATIIVIHETETNSG